MTRWSIELCSQQDYLINWIAFELHGKMCRVMSRLCDVSLWCHENIMICYIHLLRQPAHAMSFYICISEEVQDDEQRENWSSQTHQLSRLSVRIPHSYKGHLIPIRISPRATHSRHFSADEARRLTEPSMPVSRLAWIHWSVWCQRRPEKHCLCVSPQAEQDKSCVWSRLSESVNHIQKGSGSVYTVQVAKYWGEAIQ